MPQYRDINDLLLNTNKGEVGIGDSVHQAPGLPSPGDGVTVSIVDRGFLNVLIHHVDPGNLRCRGETIRHISDSKGNEIVNRAEYVTFSYKKVAGIHRQ